MRWLPITLLVWSIASAAQATSKEAEDWAWKQIRTDRIANFNEHCKTEVDPRKEDSEWNNECRHISAKFLQDVLTDPQRQAELRRHRVRLEGARIDGPIDLDGIDSREEIQIVASKIEGDLSLADSHWSRGLTFDESVIAGTLVANGLRCDKDISFERTVFGAEVNLRGAEILGALTMTRASFAGALSASVMSVGYGVFLGGATFSGDVNLAFAKLGAVIMNDYATFGAGVKLTYAKIAALTADDAYFVKGFDASYLRGGSDLSMKGATFNEDVDLPYADIDRLTMDDGSFAKVNAYSLRVKNRLSMDGATFSGDVDLRFATVGGVLSVANHASFRGELDASHSKVATLGVNDTAIVKEFSASYMTVEGPIFMMRSTFEGGVDLTDAKVHGQIVLDGSITSRLDFSSAEVQELDISGLGWRCTQYDRRPDGRHWKLGDAVWRSDSCDNGPLLILRNAHLGALQDSDFAWPLSLDLEGLRYDRLGGEFGTGSGDMRRRTPKQWIDWLARDLDFSTQPYVQLASVLLSTGHRDTAERVQYAGQERERQEAWDQGDRLQWAWLTTLRGVVGYGIGLYISRVFYCVLALIVLGTAVLWFSQNARRRGLAWRLGASLHRLLPAIELTKDFTDFFDNPATTPAYEPRNLNRFQVAFFVGFALVGWLLSFILIAAITGLTKT
jgi:uncharacterized protein YjbI with pentapeptide repeats